MKQQAALEQQAREAEEARRLEAQRRAAETNEEDQAELKDRNRPQEGARQDLRKKFETLEATVKSTTSEQPQPAPEQPQPAPEQPQPAPEQPQPASEFSEQDAQQLINNNIEKLKKLLRIKDKTDAYHLAFVCFLVYLFLLGVLRVL